MALQKHVDLENGVQIKNAYIKIVNINGNKDSVFLDVGIYKDVTYTDERYINKIYYNFKPDVSDNANNFIKQGYDYLKTLDEFKDAIDVLEENQSL